MMARTGLSVKSKRDRLHITIGSKRSVFIQVNSSLWSFDIVVVRCKLTSKRLQELVPSLDVIGQFRLNPSPVQDYSATFFAQFRLNPPLSRVTR